MKLTDWLTANGVNRSELARRIGVHPSRISQLCLDLPDGRGVRRPPSHKITAAILRETGGAVTPQDLGAVISEETREVARVMDAAATP